ncbi:TipAS antibiotic-recognition domain-containing protein [Sphaerisporangium viridialbum]|uniref:TipAS antibiotic-recognition domain-containing protein n=1 Tax=Sphaerisporangium viridialbum TaxID=46189 RepID=UPI003C75ABC9
MDDHYQGICRFWTPNAAAFNRLGQTYVDDPQRRSVYDRVADGPAEYQGDAMVVYVGVRLS